MHEVDVVIVGAGAVGLACAAALARAGHEVVVLDREGGPGRETTSRNSGVIHAGLYYPTGSLMAETCVEGRSLLYARCARDGVAHRKTEKLVVATEPGNEAALEPLLEVGTRNGAGALSLIDGAAITRLEPRVVARCALRSPESGIVDVHGLCQSYVAEAQAFGASFAYHTEVVGFAPRGDGYQVDTRRGDARFSVRAGAVVNAAGLASDRVAAMAGVDVDARGWRIRPCKGDYFAIAPRLGRLCQRLVYPLPTAAGLGVHVTMDLGGAFRAGPDTEYLDAEYLDASDPSPPRYDVDPSKAARFGAALRRYLPEVRDEDLSPDYAGVRPKLYGPGEAKRDFVLEETPARVVHLVGIESPGITASEALARRVLARL